MSDWSSDVRSSDLLSSQLLDDRRASAQSVQALFQFLRLPLTNVSVPAQPSAELRIAFHTVSRSRKHGLGLLFRSMCVAQPLQQMLFHFFHGYLLASGTTASFGQLRLSASDRSGRSKWQRSSRTIYPDRFATFAQALSGCAAIAN